MVINAIGAHVTNMYTNKMSVVMHKHVRLKPNNKIITRLFKIIKSLVENFFILNNIKRAITPSD